MVYVHTEECSVLAVGRVPEYHWEVLVSRGLLESTGADFLLQLTTDAGMSRRSLAFEVVAFAHELGLEASFRHTVPTRQAAWYLL